MKGSIYHATAAAAAALFLTAWASHAQADEVTTTYSAPLAQPVVVSPPRDVVTTREKVPNAALITSGAVMFGIPYTTSFVVAASSNRTSDRHLFLPLVGPWIDLASRGQCVGPSCDGETSNKVLLVFDGLLQSAGALQFMSGFLFPTTRIVTRTASVQVAPSGGRSGMGLTAYGRF